MEEQKKSSKLSIIAGVIIGVCLLLLLLPVEKLFEKDKEPIAESNVESSFTTEPVSNNNLTIGDLKNSYIKLRDSEEFGSLPLYDLIDVMIVPASVKADDFDYVSLSTDLISLFPMDLVLPQRVEGVFSLDDAHLEDIKGLQESKYDSIVYSFSDMKVVDFVSDNTVILTSDMGYKVVVKYITANTKMAKGDIVSINLLGSLFNIDLIENEVCICGYYIDGLV